MRTGRNLDAHPFEMYSDVVVDVVVHVGVVVIKFGRGRDVDIHRRDVNLAGVDVFAL